LISLSDDLSLRQVTLEETGTNQKVKPVGTEGLMSTLKNSFGLISG